MQQWNRSTPGHYLTMKMLTACFTNVLKYKKAKMLGYALSLQNDPKSSFNLLCSTIFLNNSLTDLQHYSDGCK